MSMIVRIALLSAVLLAAYSPQAVAQAARSGGNAGAQMMQQLQQLAAERTSLQAENARLKRELETLRKERDALSGGREALDRRARASEAVAARSAAEREDLARELERQKSRMEELIAKFRETAEALRDTENEHTEARQTLARRDADLATCVDRNTALYALNGEILDRLERRGFWSNLAAAEPFTRLKRVQLENLADEYRQKAEDQRIPENQRASEASASPPTAASGARPAR
jgi:chromosome segregation ATPase